jgi:hypothetical protein
VSKAGPSEKPPLPPSAARKGEVERSEGEGAARDVHAWSSHLNTSLATSSHLPPSAARHRPFTVSSVWKLLGSLAYKRMASVFAELSKAVDRMKRGRRHRNARVRRGRELRQHQTPAEDLLGRVLRFENECVIGDVDAVAREIAKTLGLTPQIRDWTAPPNLLNARRPQFDND